MMDPHGAVGYLGLESFRKNKPDTQGIFLETAHPVKFLEVVEPVIHQKIAYPPQILAVIDKKKESTRISDYSELKAFLHKPLRMFYSFFIGFFHYATLFLISDIFLDPEDFSIFTIGKVPIPGYRE